MEQIQIDRGRIMGAASTAAGVGRVGGPLLGGALLSLLGFRAAWILAFLMVAGYWAWAFLHLRRDAGVVHEAH